MEVQIMLRRPTDAGRVSPPKKAEAAEMLTPADAKCPQAAQSRSATALGDALKAARQNRGISQFDLALEAGISQRHIAFIEVGRAKPSRALLIRLLDHLGCCPSSRNAALYHAGYLPEGLGTGPEADQLDRALREMVEAHFPFPAMVFDAEWHVRLASTGAWWLFSQVMPGLWVPDILPFDIIAAIASPDGVLSKAKEPALLGAALLSQIEAEAWATPSLRPRLELCASTLEDRYGPLPKNLSDSAALTPRFDTGHGELSFFSIQLVPGMPHNVSVDSLRVELSFPADEKTREIVMREVAPVQRDDLSMIDLPGTVEKLIPA